MSAPKTERRVRRSLTHVGGDAVLAGDEQAARELANALDVPPSVAESGEGPDRAHVHGFHTYPARMHPITARRLVEAFAPPGGTVLDPFCGSGTVLVEAMLAGRNARGIDLNPLAVVLARLKTQPRAHAELDALLAAADDAAAHATERRAARAGATRRYPPEDVAVFEPHVLLELDGLRAGIATGAETTRQPLLLVLSSILQKLSRKEGDTSLHTAPRRIAAGYPAKLFVKKTEELARRIDELTRALPRPAPRVTVDTDDATRLRTVKPASIDCAISSPPYAATYDYVAHHALRMRWLGLDSRPLEKGELGARRHFASLDGESAKTTWSRQLEDTLRALARVLRPGASVVLVMADSAVAGVALRADAMLAEVAPRTGFALVARASQARPHFHGPTLAAFRSAPRAEHALLLHKRDERGGREKHAR